MPPLSASPTPHASQPDPTVPAPPAPADPDPTPATRPSLRPADPAEVAPTDHASAGRVFVVMLGVLVLAALLNAGAMRQRAETSALGPEREAALAIWEPIDAAAAAVGLDQPRAGLDAVRADAEPGRLTTIEAASPPANPLGHRALTPAELPTVAPAGPTATPFPGSTTPLGLPTPSMAADPAGPGPLAVPPEAGVIATGPTAPTGDTGTGVEEPTGDTDGSAATPARVPTAEDPLRLLVTGDSTVEPVGNAILRSLADDPTTAAWLDVRISTGLSRPDFFDWPAHLSGLLPETRAEVLVVMLGANDAQSFVADGRMLTYGTDEWFAAYRARVATIMDQATAAGAFVVWLGQPTMRDAAFEAKLTPLNQIFAAEAAARPGRAVYVDTARAMSVDGSGAYTPTLVDGSGHQRVVRSTDGIHMTNDGGEILAPIVVETVAGVAPLGGGTPAG
ncbi:MAG: DUF459 domain-containing protein [Acidimicrobiales bacterium]